MSTDRFELTPEEIAAARIPVQLQGTEVAVHLLLKRLADLTDLHANAASGQFDDAAVRVITDVRVDMLSAARQRYALLGATVLEREAQSPDGNTE